MHYRRADVLCGTMAALFRRTKQGKRKTPNRVLWSKKARLSDTAPPTAKKGVHELVAQGLNSHAEYLSNCGWTLFGLRGWLVGNCMDEIVRLNDWWMTTLAVNLKQILFVFAQSLPCLEISKEKPRSSSARNTACDFVRKLILKSLLQTKRVHKTYSIRNIPVASLNQKTDFIPANWRSPPLLLPRSIHQIVCVKAFIVKSWMSGVNVFLFDCDVS